MGIITFDDNFSDHWMRYARWSSKAPTGKLLSELPSSDGKGLHTTCRQSLRRDEPMVRVPMLLHKVKEV